MAAGSIRREMYFGHSSWETVSQFELDPQSVTALIARRAATTKL